MVSKFRTIRTKNLLNLIPAIGAPWFGAGVMILLMFLEIVPVAKLLATRLALVRLVVGRLVFVIGV